MNISQIENNINTLVGNLAEGTVVSDDFIYELLLAYGHRPRTVSMLKNGHYNIAKKPDEIIFKRHLYFKKVESDVLYAEIDRMKNEKLVSVNRTRFVIVTNFKQLLAIDTKTNDMLDVEMAELPKKFDFFLPWAGMEKAVYQGENPADIKAAEKMAKLFDLIKADNFTEETLGDKDALHSLNVFLTRLLFCYFAEDTEIFTTNQFSKAIESHTKQDGSDLAQYLDRLFIVLNTDKIERDTLPDYLSDFPYVNGGLFADELSAPKFSRKSRRMLIECGSELDWSDINPDIFGSMIQAVVHPDQRGGMGMHYTSVTNIMKVIEPLFLNDLYEELDKVSNSASKLQKLQQRLGDIKIFDPACGSGNFLIIAYKELRKLEMELLKLWQDLELKKSGQVLQPFSVIKLSQFYGIELDDFAHEVAILSLWLAEHQMNVEFRAEFGEILPSLPLKSGGEIVSGNSLVLNWEDVCPPSGVGIYILGNPPYVGARKQNHQQRLDLQSAVVDENISTGSLDYIAGWLFRSKCYMENNNKIEIKTAFVSTSSICQGEQANLIWNNLLRSDIEIQFGIPSFRWTNNARNQAGVFCIIVGFCNKKYIKEKKLLVSDHWVTAEHINPYLTMSKVNAVIGVSRSICGLPKMGIGNKPIDGGNYLFTESEKNNFVINEPGSLEYFSKWFGAREFTSGQHRWCLLAQKIEVSKLKKMAKVQEVVASVKRFRLASTSRPTIAMAERPRQFHVENFPDSNYIIVPKVSSSVKEYLPIGFFDRSLVSSDLLNVVDSNDLFYFGLLSSKIHLLWVAAVSGKFGNGIRYSSKICWNTFPVPKVSEEAKEVIREKSIMVLQERENFPDKNISYLYSENMPTNLRDAHIELDMAVDKLYSIKQFESDEERLDLLFDMYEKIYGGLNA